MINTCPRINTCPSILAGLCAIAMVSSAFAEQSSVFEERSGLLFNGHSLAGWTTQKGDQVPAGWQAEAGVLHLKGGGGHIVTEREYGDFDLSFEWKISPGGNSGIKYRVRQFGGRTLGCEYQILDDAGHRDGLKGKKSTGSLYDVYAPNANKFLRPAGQYNQGRVRVLNNQVQHWLNGHLILSAQIGSRDWQEKIADSKFADVEGFGLNQRGKIMLTDHKSETWYRNIILTPLESSAAAQLASMPAATDPPVSPASCCCPQRRPAVRRWLFSR